MELKSALMARASVRQYTSDAVAVDDLKEMVRLAGLAPSVNNSQPWRFIAIVNPVLLHEMGKAVHEKLSSLFINGTCKQATDVITKVDWFSTFFADAPAVIAVCKRPYEAVIDDALQFGDLTHDQLNVLRGMPDIQSLGAAIENLLLAAVDLGYGACWLSGPLVARDELQAVLSIQDPWTLAAMVAVGKPAGEAQQKPKKDLDEIFELRG